MAEDTKQPIKKAKSAAKAPPSINEAQAGAVVALNQAPAEEISSKAASAAQTLKDSAGKMAKQATDKARDYVSEGKSRAGGALDEMSKMMSDAATTVDEKLGPQYGQYARTAAEGLAGFSESLKAKEIEDLVADAQSFVRKSPAVAIGVAAAVGFVVARLVKAGLDAADTIADGPAPTDTAKSAPSRPKSPDA